MIDPNLIIALMGVSISLVVVILVVTSTPKRQIPKTETFKEVAQVSKTTVQAPPKVPIPEVENIIGQPYTNLEELPIGNVITGELTKIRGNKRIVIKRLG